MLIKLVDFIKFILTLRDVIFWVVDPLLGNTKLNSLREGRVHRSSVLKTRPISPHYKDRRFSPLSLFSHVEIVRN
jgi:hypothetical protein